MIIFFAENWGNVASASGAFLTVVFSWRANTAATLANKASQATRAKLQTLDLLGERNRLSGRIDDLNHRLDAKAWTVIGERATDLRVSIAAVLANKDAVFSNDLSEKLTEAVSQFRTLASASDRISLNSALNPNIPRYKSIVADQKETVVLALQEAKIKMEEKS